MTHQTLIPSAPAPLLPTSSAPLVFNRSSSTSATCSSAAAPNMASFVAHHHGSLVEREGRMAALRTSLRPCVAAEEVAAAAASGPAAWGAGDRSVGLFVEGFSVEDLLDLEELCEVDKDVAAELGEAAPSPTGEENKSSPDSHGSSSVVSYELMPLPPPVMDLPAHDAEELEWVSRIMDDSLAELPPAPHLPAASFALRRQQQHEQPAVPPRMVPVPTPTICALSTEALVPVKAKRSKRARGSVWSLSGAAPLSDSTSSSSTTATSSCSSSSAASFPPLLLLDSSPFAHLVELAPPRPKKCKNGKSSKPKKRGRKPKHQHPAQFAGGGDASAPAPGDRRCSHCGVQKTPQWRAGPEGAKTLCNACGVRYKSGRLLPEYRPACSPTFVSSIHSNSHRKVLEMRRKKEDLPLVPAAAAPAVASF